MCERTAFIFDRSNLGPGPNKKTTRSMCGGFVSSGGFHDCVIAWLCLVGKKMIVLRWLGAMLFPFGALHKGFAKDDKKQRR